MDARITTVDLLGDRPQPLGGDQGPGTSSVCSTLSEDLLHEAEACKLAQARVQELLLEAARAVCPEYCGVWAIPKDAVQPSATAGGGGDLECRAPSTVWRKLLAAARGAPVRITTVSEFGVRREAEYASAADLARALVASLPDESRDVVADVRVREDGRLAISTQLHMRRQRAAGLLHCSACGGFFAGRRGLRDHQQIKHRTSYEEAHPISPVYLP